MLLVDTTLENPNQTSTATGSANASTNASTSLPQGHHPVVGASGKKIVYDKDGKPCRTCNSLLDFRSVTQAQKGASTAKASTGIAGAGIAAAAVASSTSSATASGGYKKDCPADVEVLGRSSWTFLHSLAATYPAEASQETQNDMTQFIGLFAKFYPCWFCAKDFQEYTKKEKPKVKTQEEFGKWLCDAHNEVNVKLGKPKFDCNLWKQRWKDGWEDGSCD